LSLEEIFKDIDSFINGFVDCFPICISQIMLPMQPDNTGKSTKIDKKY